MTRLSVFKLLVCILLLVSTLAVYWPVQGHDFVNLDDNLYVTDNRHVQAGLTWEGIVWAFSSSQASNWHPLTWLSHMLDCELFGLDPQGHHLTSSLLHAANSILLFLLFSRMTGALWRSAFVAALFALHPLHVESVAWISERKDVLSTFFWILTMWSYVRYVASPGAGRYLLVFLLLAFGLMAKPMLVTLPFVLLLMDYWPLGRIQFGHSGNPIQNRNGAGYQRSPTLHLVWEKAPLIALSAASSIVTFLMQHSGGAVQSSTLFPMEARVANALVAYVSYIGKMIWPRNLAVFYPHPGNIVVWKAMAAGLLILALSVLVIRGARRYPYLSAGWLWYLGTLVPVIGLVQIGAQSMADRYTYVPFIGLFVMIAWGVTQLTARWRFRHLVLSVSAGLVLTALMICTRMQAGYWQNSVSLFEHAVNVTDDNYLAHVSLGIALYEQGRVDEAIAHYNQSMQINTNYPIAHNSLGAALLRKGEFEEAIPHFSRALEIDPKAEGALANLQTALQQIGTTTDEAASHNLKAIALAGEGKLDEAIVELSKALRLKPKFAEAHYNMGNALAGQDKLDEAIDHFSEAILIKPDYPEAHNNLGILLARKGKLDDAVDHFSEALRIRPDFAEAQNNLKRSSQRTRKP
jgi:tetratricopeptide (TPR) repeat protein